MKKIHLNEDELKHVAGGSKPFSADNLSANVDRFEEEEEEEEEE